MKRVVFPVLLALASCAAPPPPAYAPQPQVPAMPPEVRPLPPVSKRPLTWQPGHYDYNAGSYVMVPGRYIDRAQAGSGLWMQGYWTPNGTNWMWQPAHWQ